jgi:3-hydroxyisobutyrate dehydrogenase-like beta-hydroxyacid dehydrogenase
MTIAICGLGIIGATWAEILREDGLEVRAWNRTFKPVPGAVRSVHEAVTGADFVFIVVSDPAAVGSVLGEALPHLKPGQTVIQSSTIGPADSRRFAELVGKPARGFWKRPSPAPNRRAQARQVVFYLGGDADLIDHARPFWNTSPKRCCLLARWERVGFEIGDEPSNRGRRVGDVRGLSLARAAGINDDTFFGALELNVARSGLVDLKRPKLQENDFAPQFSLKHMAKICVWRSKKRKSTV